MPSYLCQVNITNPDGWVEVEGDDREYAACLAAVTFKKKCDRNAVECTVYVDLKPDVRHENGTPTVVMAYRVKFTTGVAHHIPAPPALTARGAAG